MTRTSNSSSMLNGSIRPLTAMVIVLVFVMFSGVVLGQFSSSSTISSEGKGPSSFLGVKANEGLDWFQKWIETSLWNGPQSSSFADGKVDVSSNSVNTLQVAVGVGVYWDINC